MVQGHECLLLEECQLFSLIIYFVISIEPVCDVTLSDLLGLVEDLINVDDKKNSYND